MATPSGDYPVCIEQSTAPRHENMITQGDKKMYYTKSTVFVLIFLRIKKELTPLRIGNPPT